MSDGGSVARGNSDGELLRALHQQHAEALTAYLMQLTGGDLQRSQGAVEETLHRAWRDPALLRHAQESVRGRLFALARIVVSEDRRSDGHGGGVATADPHTTAASPSKRSLDSFVVIAALSHLSTEQRQILIECFLHESSVSRAAVRLGIPAGTVKSRCHYALMALELALDEFGAIP